MAGLSVKVPTVSIHMNPQVNTLTPEEKTAFKEALAPMYEKYKAEFGEEIFSMAEEYGQ